MKSEEERPGFLGWPAIYTPALILFVAGALGIFLQHQASHALASVRQTESVLRTRTRVLGRFVDALAAERGYLITGDERYIADHERVDGDIDSLLTTLRAITAESPAQLARLDSLDLVGDAFLARLDTMIALRRTGGLPAVQAQFVGMREKSTMETLRALFYSIEQEAAGRRDDRLRALTRTWRAAVWTIALGFMLAVISALLVGGVFTKMLRRQRLASISLDQQNRALARQNAALGEQSQFLQAILEAMHDAVIAVDANGTVRFSNGAASRMLAFEPKETREHAPHIAAQLRYPDGRPLTPDKLPLNRALRGEKVVEEELHWYSPDGTKAVRVGSAHPIWGGGHVMGGVAIIRDETSRRAADEALARTQAQLAQAQKMEAVGQLAGGIAHDFNNVLTAIVGGADLALMSRQLGDDVREDITQIRDAGMRASGVTRQLLMLSRKQLVQPRTIDANDMLRHVEPLVRRSLSEDIDLEVDCRADDAVVADPAQCEQVILNLALNARDAMPAGGHLRITTRSEVVARPRMVTTGELKSGRYVALEVADTGSGMSEHVLSHMFEPFFTTKSAANGTGLGLATVYGIVLQSGGRIDVRSTVGIGTTFTVYFPAADDGAEHPAPATHARDQLRGSETVLVVEDEAGVRGPICRTLRSLGYEVLEAKHGEDAITVLEEHAVPVDLVVTDLVMPHMGGAELIRTLRQEEPRLRALFISGYSEDMLHWKGALTNGTTYLAKPFGMDTLAATVRRLLDIPLAERNETLMRV